MIKVSVLYPKTDSSTFDMQYYRDVHIPMAKQKLGEACSSIQIDLGLAGGAPDQAPAFAAIGHLYFASVTVFQEAFGPHAEVIMADLPNFTGIEPIIQISEVIQ